MKYVILSVLCLASFAKELSIHDSRSWPDCSKAKNPTACEEYQKQVLWSTPQCKCIKNANGECMYISKRRPTYSRGLGTHFQFLPSCVNDCLPGWSEIEGTDPQTQKEIAHCYVDWDRLKKLNPQWSDPNWTP